MRVAGNFGPGWWSPNSSALDLAMLRWVPVC